MNAHYTPRWPLNTRELEQALRAAIALADTGEIYLEHLPETIRTYAPRAWPTCGSKSASCASG
jgi:transcriptional regulator of acetoin/glycerol metabolism